MVKKSELGYVKKRKRRRLARIITAICSLGLGVFILVSFLGRFTGTFTVSLNTGDVKLSLSKESQFEESTAFIKLETMPAFGEMTFTSLPPFSELDSEETYYTDFAHYNSDGTKINDIPFFKYTFFIRNNGEKIARYNFSLNITTNYAAIDGTGRTIDQILRVMIFENDAFDTESHNYSVYAKKSESTNYDQDNNPTTKEYISYSVEKANRYGIEFPGFAEEFEDNNTVATFVTNNFAKGDAKRYTLVLWIEGEDPQQNGEIPEGAKMKLGVTINAYEN